MVTSDWLVCTYVLSSTLYVKQPLLLTNATFVVRSNAELAMVDKVKQHMRSLSGHSLTYKPETTVSG